MLMMQILINYNYIFYVFQALIYIVQLNFAFPFIFLKNYEFELCCHPFF